MKTMYNLSKICLAITIIISQYGCSRQNASYGYTNPIFTTHDNTSICFHDGVYYYIIDDHHNLMLLASSDPTTLANAEPRLICEMDKEHGLQRLWHPQIINITGKWYIYCCGDTGNTDHHRIYAMECDTNDPMTGKFKMIGEVETKPGNHWAIHAHVFQWDEQLYMLWAGWENQRVDVQTHYIYIAEMVNPWTLSTDRVLISKPEYEWERQWVNQGGYKTSYPFFVNEAPYFFGSDTTDSLYIYFSASAMWTTFYSIGVLSAAKGSNLTDANSWHKHPEPVLKTDKERGVYSPGLPYVIPSPDGSEYYFIYRARYKMDNPYEPFSRDVRMQRIEFTSSGHPILGHPEPTGKLLPKPSGLPN